MQREQRPGVGARRRPGADPLRGRSSDPGPSVGAVDCRWRKPRRDHLGRGGRSRRPRHQGGHRSLGAGCGGNEVLRPWWRWRRFREQLGGWAVLFFRRRHPHRIDSQPPGLQQRGPCRRGCRGRHPQQRLCGRRARRHHPDRRRQFLRNPDQLFPRPHGAQPGRRHDDPQARRPRRRTGGGGAHDHRR